MNSMTREEFVTVLSSKVGAFPVGLLTRTEPKVRKTGNPNPEVVRVTRRNAFLGGSYESIVNNAQERQGGERDFEAGSLPWGKVVNKFLIENKGKLYLRYFPVATGCKGEDTWMTPDGAVLDFSVVEPFLPKSKPGNDAGVAWRTVALENVQEVTLDGQTVSLVDGVKTPTSAAA